MDGLAAVTSVDGVALPRSTGGRARDGLTLELGDIGTRNGLADGSGAGDGARTRDIQLGRHIHDSKFKSARSGCRSALLQFLITGPRRGTTSATLCTGRADRAGAANTAAPRPLLIAAHRYEHPPPYSSGMVGDPSVAFQRAPRARQAWYRSPTASPDCESWRVTGMETAFPLAGKGTGPR